MRIRAVIATAGLAAAVTSTLASDAIASEPTVRVMSYNINHGAGNPCTPMPPVAAPVPDCSVAKLQLAADVIREYGPDLIGLQEVDRSWGRSGYVDQATLLSRELGMYVCYGANLEQRPDDHSVVDHQYGTAILSRFPIRTCRNTLLPKANTETEQRGLAEVVVRVRGVPLHFFTTHLQNCSPHIAAPCGPGNPDRTVQVKAILERIGASNCVLTGDLNANPDWPELAPLYRRFRDAWLLGAKGSGYTYPAGPDGDPSRRLDYVLVRGLHVFAASAPITTKTRLSSDHYPVIATVALEGG